MLVKGGEDERRLEKLPPLIWLISPISQELIGVNTESIL
jgi:hypothetical protein